MRDLLPHEERVVQEREELDLKIVKLQGFLLLPPDGVNLTMNQFKMLRMQVFAMEAYRRILDIRIDMFEESYKEGKGASVIGFFGEENKPVMDIKAAAMLFIDVVDTAVKDPRRKAIAITKMEEAQMMAVKGLFN